MRPRSSICGESNGRGLVFHGIRNRLAPSARPGTVRAYVPAATVFDWLFHALTFTWHNSSAYNFVSGPLADITLFGGLYALYRHHNCHVKGCWRIARRAVDGTTYVVCHRHHPGEKPTAEQVHAEHLAYHRRQEASSAGPTQPVR